MNSIFLLGRLTKDPEVRYTTTGRVAASFTLAVDRPFTNQAGEREADFINCVIWGKPAETLGNTVSKGQRLMVEGRLQIRAYDGKDGQKRWMTEVIVNNFEYIERKAQSAQAGNYQANGYQQGGYQPGGYQPAMGQPAGYQTSGYQPAMGQPSGYQAQGYNPMGQAGSEVPDDVNVPF